MRIKTASRAAILAGLALAAGQACAEEAAPPLSFGAVLTSDLLANTSGGLKTGARAMHNLDLTAAWTGEGGWSAQAYVLGDTGGGFSEMYSGDGQVVSNIDAPEGVRLFEAWVRKDTADGKASVIAGLININGLFDVQDTGGLFLNSSHGMGADYAQSGPSIFPISGLGAAGEWHPTEALTLRGGVFDAVPGNANDPDRFAYIRLAKDEGAHVVAEAEYDFDGGRVKLGHWANSVAVPIIDGSGEAKPSGTYGQVQFTLIPGKTPDMGLHGWVRAGVARDSVLDLDRYSGGGVVLTGTFPGRDDDMAGLSVASAHFGAAYRAAFGAPVASETTWEASYRIAVTDRVSLQPDVQYVIHPGGDPSVKNALVVGLRLRIDLLGG